MERILDQVIAHQEIIDKMLESFEAGRPGQTFLFVGPSGIGKKLTATGLAQALICEKGRRACGKCPSCLRVAHGHHEGLKLIEPTGVNIKIEQAREAIEFLSLKSLGGNRVIIIDQAQTLNPQAANSLLKTLEEPPEGTFFFLIAPQVAGLMATIRSRSRVVQFKPLTAEELGRKVKAPAWALKAAGGSFEKLAQLEEGPEQELRKKAIQVLDIFLKDKDFLLNDVWRQEFKDRSQGQRILAYWSGFFRDGIVLQEQATSQIVNLDQSTLIKTLAEQTRPKLLDLIQRSLAAEQALMANRDAQLVIEDLWIKSKDI
jgi:DNA polymerase-3 subunit delta'